MIPNEYTKAQSHLLAVIWINLSEHLSLPATLSPSPKVESVCLLLSSVLRERAGRGGEEGEAVTEEESQTGDQRRQDGEQSSGESTSAAANLPPHQGNTVFLFLSLKMCSLLISAWKTAHL